MSNGTEIMSCRQDRKIIKKGAAGVSHSAVNSV